MDKRKRCTWPGTDPLYIEYHDKEWGVPVFDDRLLFEMINLEGAQAGLSWITILRKRHNYQRLFDNFEVKKIARYTDKKLEKILTDPGIVRNRLKVYSVKTNAHVCEQVKAEFGSFSNYIWHFTDGKPIINEFKSLQSIPAKTPLSDSISKDMKKRGFKFVGSTIVYAFLQAVGIVNDHVTTCYRWRECQ